MQQKKFIIIGIALFVAIIIATYFLFLRKPSQVPVSQEATQPGIQEDVTVPTIAPSSLGLTFVARADGKAVKFTIANASDIQSVDYEISYTAQGNIPRGAIGHIEKKAEDSTLASNYIDLGTCSSGKCKYDAGVTSVKLILKIMKTDGKSYASEKTLQL